MVPSLCMYGYARNFNVFQLFQIFPLVDAYADSTACLIHPFFSLKHRMPAPVIPPPRTSLSNHIHGNLPPSFFCNYPSAHVSLCSPLPCFHPSLFLCTTSTPSMPVDDIPFLGEETPMRGRHRATVPFERRDVSRWR